MMLQRMRHGAQSFGAKVLVAVIIIVLALFGFGAFNIFVSPDPAVATVNGADIPRSRVELEVERQRREMMTRFGDQFDPDMLDGGMIRASVIENLINREVLVQAMEDMNMAISDEQIDRMIFENPQFHSGGRFDPDLYRMLLASIGHSPASFRREYARDVLLTKLDTALTESPFITEQQLRLTAALMNQQRDLAFLRFRWEDFLGDAAERVTDEDVDAFYDAYRRDFMTEEHVDVTYVELRLDQVAQQIDVDVTEEELRDLYEQERSTFQADEERSAAHILLTLDDRSEEEARELLQSIRQRVESGEDFGALAQEYSEDPGSARMGGELGYISPGMMVSEFENALWQLEEGEVSEPVVTQYGIHLIKLDDIRGDAHPTFEERAPELRQQLALVHAREQFAARVRELDRLAFDSPESLEPLAEQFGLEIQSVEGVTREDGAPPFDRAELRREVYSDDVLEGMNSRLIQVEDSAVVARVVEHHQARQLPLEEVAEQIRERLVRDEAERLAAVAADEAEQRLRDGDSAGVVARAFDRSWRVVERARRDAGDIPRPVTQAAFALPRPAPDGRSVGSARIGAGDFAVITVTRTVDGDPDAMPEEQRNLLQRELRQANGSQEFEALFRTVRDEARIRRRT